jgi:membrane protease YdiL (CAAX protease family)
LASSDATGEKAARPPVDPSGIRLAESASLLVGAIAAAEALMALGAFTAGLVLEMLVILALAQMSVFGGFDARTAEGRRVVAALLAVPLLRVITIVIIPLELEYEIRLLFSSMAAVVVIAGLSVGLRLPEWGLRARWGRLRARRVEHLAFISTAIPISLGFYLIAEQLGAERLYQGVGTRVAPFIIVAAIVEEYVFRGFIQGQFRGAGVERGVWLTGILYVFTYMWWGSPTVIVWAIAAAALYGWYRQETGAVWAVACNHALALFCATILWPVLVS